APLSPAFTSASLRFIRFRTIPNAQGRGRCDASPSTAECVPHPRVLLHRDARRIEPDRSGRLLGADRQIVAPVRSGRSVGPWAFPTGKASTGNGSRRWVPSGGWSGSEEPFRPPGGSSLSLHSASVGFPSGWLPRGRLRYRAFGSC